MDNILLADSDSAAAAAPWIGRDAILWYRDFWRVARHKQDMVGGGSGGGGDWKCQKKWKTMIIYYPLSLSWSFKELLLLMMMVVCGWVADNSQVNFHNFPYSIIAHEKVADTDTEDGGVRIA